MKSAHHVLIFIACRVSTLAVEWIEIVGFTILVMAALVSTLAVEWIEMSVTVNVHSFLLGLHPRGGVD